jgi:phosphoglycolate phosphatase-like HAD superfamily hydrolase
VFRLLLQSAWPTSESRNAAISWPLRTVTNTQKSHATSIVERAGATPDVVVGGGDAHRSKPAPDPLLLASRLLNVGPGEAWMVGDTSFDREAALGAGIFFVGVRFEGDARVEALAQLLDLIASSR